MKPKVAHVTGVCVSAGAGSVYAAMLPFPFGLQAIYFHTMAPVAGFLGYEFGRWLGTFGFKPIILAPLAIVVSPIAVFAYDSMLHLGHPSMFNSSLIFMLFATAIFALATAFGIIGFKVEKLNNGGA